MPAILENTVLTEVPGPLSKARAKQLSAYFDARTVLLVVDYEKSSGN
jgi:4-aminobutyrate aminotransferase/(S)-3-amino-2-methylpropionate transaminase